MVGTSTSQRVAASASCSIVIGVSVVLSSTSKSSLIRVSTGSGSRRVTMTFTLERGVGMPGRIPLGGAAGSPVSPFVRSLFRGVSKHIPHANQQDQPEGPRIHLYTRASVRKVTLGMANADSPHFYAVG